MNARILSYATRYRTALYIVGGTALVTVILFATGPHAIPEEADEKAWPITVMDVKPTYLRPSFSVFGRYEANQRAALSSDLMVRVGQVLVREGDQVRVGDELIRLNAGDVERRLKEMSARRNSAKAALESMHSELKLAERTREDYAALHNAAQSKLARHRELLTKRLISQILFDEVQGQAAEASIRFQSQERVLSDLPNRLVQAQSDLAAAEAGLEQARVDLDETIVRAPFDGPILSVTVAAGEMNVPGKTLLEISSTDSFELRLEVPDRYVGRLERYLDANVAVPAMTEDGREFKLARMGRQVRSGQSGVDAFFLPADPQAKTSVIGRVLRASITLPAEADLVALPTESIYENDRIYRVIDRRLQAIQIERVGETSVEGRYQVLVRAAELKGGASVLVTQLPQAVSGMLVAPIQGITGQVAALSGNAIALAQHQSPPR
jgi:HlyD family secretion protein